MRKFTLHPRSVCRNLLTRLEGIKPLSAQDEARILRSIESTDIPDGVDRMLAGLSRQTLKELLKNI